MNVQSIWRRFDFALFAAVFFLSIFGVALISSAIAGNIELAEHPQRQATFLAIGLVLLFLVAAYDYHVWQSLIKPFYVVVAVFLIFVYVMGETSFGATRWLQVGLLVVQPAELAKIVIIMVLADFFAKNITKINNWWTIGRSFLITLGLVLWILLQPNLSTSIVILVIWAAMLWISGLKAKNILIGVGIVALFLGGSIATDFPYLADYQKGRVQNFFNKPTDDQARYGDTYNVDQAQISIGSGGWFGQGYGQGTQVQLRFLKIRHNDFIFSVLANEFGFFGTTLVLLLIVFVIVRCFVVAKNAPDAYGSLLAFGFGVLMAFQTIVNVGVNLRLLPVTGLTLPFLSYGGSSLVSMLMGIGLVQNIRMRSETRDARSGSEVGT